MIGSLLRREGPLLVRSYWIGATTGAVLCVLDLCVSSAELEPGHGAAAWFLRRASLVTLVAGFYGALGTLSYGLPGWVLRLNDRARRWILGGALGGLAGVHLISLALKVSAGDFLSLGAAQFCFISTTACTSEIIGTHSWALAVVVTGGAAVGALSSFGVRARAPAWLSPRGGGPKLAAFGVVCSFAAAVHAMGAGMQRVPSDLNAELSLLASIWEAAGPVAVEPMPTASVAQTLSAAPRGDQLSAHDHWMSEAVVSPSAPNVLLLILESVPARKLGFEGHSRLATPNMDRLAKNSVRFRRAWTTATHSNYAQMAVLSSLFPRRRASLDMYHRLDYPRFLFHDAFDVLGYQTATISSQDERWQGMRRFQRTATPTHYFHAPDHPGRKFGKGHGQVISDAVTQRQASEWIRDRAGKKWALYVNFQGTHFPYYRQPGAARRFEPSSVNKKHFSYLKYPKYMRTAANNRYDNALYWVDAQVGALREALEQSGQLENTLWVITSDHGELFGEHGLVTHGRTLFDAEARVPFIMHWPRGLGAKDVYHPVSTLDVLPTVLGALDVAPHPSFQGSARIGGESTTHRVGIFMNIQGLRSAEAVVCWPWKAVVLHPRKRTQLFHLEDDPEELRDRAADHPSKVQVLGDLLRSHIAAQMSYHRRARPTLSSHFAPRLAHCPSLPETAGEPEPQPP